MSLALQPIERFVVRKEYVGIDAQLLVVAVVLPGRGVVVDAVQGSYGGRGVGNIGAAEGGSVFDDALKRNFARIQAGGGGRS